MKATIKLVKALKNDLYTLREKCGFRYEDPVVLGKIMTLETTINSLEAAIQEDAQALDADKQSIIGMMQRKALPFKVNYEFKKLVDSLGLAQLAQVVDDYCRNTYTARWKDSTEIVANKKMTHTGFIMIDKATGKSIQKIMFVNKEGKLEERYDLVDFAGDASFLNIQRLEYPEEGPQFWIQQAKEDANLDVEILKVRRFYGVEILDN